MNRARQQQNALAKAARDATANGPGDLAAHRRRAFDLAHRARRLLEVTAETASRERWDELQAPQGTPPSAPEARFATLCAASVIRYPPYGEAAVYAALLDAVDVARRVADQLHREWLATQRTENPLPVPRGVNRLSVALADGCSRADCRGPSGEENAS